MAKAKTTVIQVDATAEMIGQLDLKIEAQRAEIAKIWALLQERMNGDGRVTKAMAKVDEG